MKMQEESKRQLKLAVKAAAESVEDAACGYYDGEKCEDEYSALEKYFEDVLDVEIISDMRGNYRGAIITLGLGGPSIYLNTREGWVKGYWGSDYAEYHVQSWAVAAVDEYFSEQWDISRGY